MNMIAYRALKEEEVHTYLMFKRREGGELGSHAGD